MGRLSAPEGRVVGALVEKALGVPQSYPLTLNALVAACNQTSSRDPVTTYTENEVGAAVESLRERRLVRVVLPSHGRSARRYRHVLDEALALDAPQLAVLCLLELRGPQTAAELRARAERLVVIDSIEHELELLSDRAEPLVERLDRRPGEKQARWASLLSDGGAQPVGTAAGGADAAGAVPATGAPAVEREIEQVRADLVELRGAVEELRAAVTALRESLGG